jgi:magnesium transporter
MAETIAEPRKRRRKPEPLYGLRPAVVQAVTDAVRDEDARRVRRLLYPLHHSDVADLLERLPGDVRRQVLEHSKRTLAPEVLTELDEAILEEAMSALETKGVAAAVQELDTDDAVEILEDLDDTLQQEILGEVDAPDRALIEESLSFPDDSAGRLMQHDAVAIPHSWTVGETIDHMRESEDLPDEFYDLFVIDGAKRLIGTLPLNSLLRARRPERVREIMNMDVAGVPATMDQEEVALLFRDRDLVSAPVLDQAGQLVGMITVDDIVDVIDEEAHEDLLRLSGVKAPDMYDDVFGTARARFSWLGLNLFTAIAASLVIAIFAQTLEQIVALAVLMPIVASMGGNAGTQTLTVAVRAIAMREFGSNNAVRFIVKEIIVGLLNGVLFALLMGAIASLWFSSPALGVVIGAAMVLNLFVAGTAGALIPLVLDRWGVDPAVASSVILTTVTDVIGFLVFLGLGTLFLLGA